MIHATIDQKTPPGIFEFSRSVLLGCYRRKKTSFPVETSLFKGNSTKYPSWTPEERTTFTCFTSENRKKKALPGTFPHRRSKPFPHSFAARSRTGLHSIHAGLRTERRESNANRQSSRPLLAQSRPGGSRVIYHVNRPSLPSL